MIKKIVLLIFIGACSLLTFGQNEDSAVYRKYNIRVIKTQLRMPMMKNRDTCLYRVQQINRKGWLTQVVEDNYCMGWASKRITDYEYDDLGRMIHIRITNNDQMETDLVLEHDSFNRVVKEKYTWFEPFQDFSISKTEYFGDPNQPDSAINTTFVNGDTVIRRVHNFYNGHLLVKSEERSDTSSRILAQTVMKYNKNKQLIRYEYSNFESYDQDQVITYTYHPNGKVHRSEDVIYETAAEFYYYKTDVPGVTFYYNKFGDLEREEFYKYEYYK